MTGREVVVLVPGHVGAPLNGRYPAGGSVTLITGTPSVIVDTGDPWQRAAILDALDRLQVTPDSIGWVINTHGHLDHVGNNNLFPSATFVLECDLAEAGRYWMHDFSRGPMVIPGATGDDGITVMSTPGHTDHDLSVIVETSIGTVAVVGDLFEHAADDDDDSWRRWSRDEDAQQHSRDVVRALASHIVPGHGDIFAVTR